MSSPSLKELRWALTEHLASQLGDAPGDVAVAHLGANVNPPCVLVASGSPYVDRSTYCVDIVRLEALILVGPGSLEAQVDNLDDLIDGVRGALLQPTYDGFRFAFQSVEAVVEFNDRDSAIPGARVHVTIEREHVLNGNPTP